MLARKGITLVCGGLTGVMEAACKGASAEGGTTIGILPGDSAADANPYVKIPIVTSMGYSRNVIVVKSGQAVIAIGGAYGTLSELACALQSGIPIVGLNTWSVSRPSSLSGEPEEDTSILRASNAADAVELAVKLARARLDKTPSS